ncbi:ATP-grasp domain-containing protein [Micromonospora sp. DT233]|uniref:ATP-grasp domain-containing protein n=1 Tax=Micromonospora sp. DT233 TaxID=3393432 RepID=UPI003CEBBC3B
MSTVVTTVVPGAAAGPADIAKAAAALGHEPLYVVVAGTLDDEAKALHSAHGPLLECDPGEPDEAVARIARHRPAGITTFSEGMVPLTSVLAHGLGLPYHDRETVVGLTNKWEQRRRLAAAGVDTLWSRRTTSRAEILAALAERSAPVVVKPVRSQSSIDTHLLRSAEDLPAELAPTPERPFVVEEYLLGSDQGEYGDYVSAETFVDGEHTYPLGVAGKYPLIAPFREQGQFLPTHRPVTEHAEVLRLATEAARALGVRRGLVHSEIKLTPDGPRIIEVNGRLGGFHAELYQRGTGQNLIELGIASACGDPVQPPPPSYDRQVQFHFWNQPPLHGGVLLGIEGVDAVRAEPGIVDYTPRVAVGRELAPTVMTFQLDLLRGHAPDHRAMLALIDRCHAHLRFAFAHADGVTRRWRPTRSGLCALD